MNRDARDVAFEVLAIAFTAIVAASVSAVISSAIAYHNGQNSMRKQAYEAGHMDYDCESRTYSWKPIKVEAEHER